MNGSTPELKKFIAIDEALFGILYGREFVLGYANIVDISAR